MPFIVTTSHAPEHDGATGYVISRLAVATLEKGCAPYATPPEGRDESMQARTDRATTYDAIRLGTPSTSLIGGTVIEVERGPGQQEMRRQLREWGVRIDTRDAGDDLIAFAWTDAFNAREASRK